MHKQWQWHCTKRKKPIWMTRKALKAVTNKRRVYRKYKNATHPAYIQAARNTRILVKPREILNINKHLDKHSLIRNTQHGFRKGYSCTTNLLVFLETVTAEIDAKHNVDAIYLDVVKAFDKVPHQHLLSKLRAYGLSGLIESCIKAWLSDRWQCVCLDDACSSWRRVWSGVPQGSVQTTQ